MLFHKVSVFKCFKRLPILPSQLLRPLIKRLLKMINSNISFSSTIGHRKLVQFLLNRGADPNAVDYGDITPLHIAAECGHLNITKILIKHGAKVNAETRISKFTPLHKAVQQNWEDIIEILIENGARTDVEDLLLGKTLSELMDNAFKNDLEKAYGNSCKCCD